MTLKRILAVLLVLLTCAALCFTASAASASKGDVITILFTHDLHSHLLPSADEDGGTYGGYARLASAIKAFTSAESGRRIFSVAIAVPSFSRAKQTGRRR